MTSTTQHDEAIAADHALKERHRTMWALGDYPAVVDEAVGPLGPVLVDACDVQPGDHVLDVAAGSGSASIPAALRGARVVATDLTPELLEVGAVRAAGHGADLKWQVADAEHLPFPDETFDVVMSCIGIMFAPHHHDAADELLRVARPGGRVGVLSWTPEGFVGQMFATMKPYAPAPPPGAQPPPLWGRLEHVDQLFGDRVTDVRATRSTLRVDCFATGEEFRDFFKACYGPTIVTYRNIADAPERVAELDEALADLGRRSFVADGVMEWEYLVCTAVKASA